MWRSVNAIKRFNVIKVGLLSIVNPYRNRPTSTNSCEFIQTNLGDNWSKHKFVIIKGSDISETDIS